MRRILDEQGRIFGRVNVLDAIVVGLVAVAAIAVVVAAFPQPLQPLALREQASVYAQVDYSELPDAQAARIAPGALLDRGAVEVTDVVRIPLGDDRSRLFAELALPVNRTADLFRYENTTLQPGAELKLLVGGFNATATIVRVDDQPGIVPLAGPDPYLFSTTRVPAPVAARLAAGLVAQLDEHHFFTITNVSTVPASAATVDLYALGTVVRYSGEGPQGMAPPTYAEGPANLSFPRESLQGAVRRADHMVRHDVAFERLGVRVDVPDPGGLVAGGLRPGDREQVGGITFAEVREVLPVATGVWADIEVNAIRIGDALAYRGTPLEPGEAFRFNGAQPFEGTVLRVGLPETPQRHVVVDLLAANVDPLLQEALQPGVVEVSGTGDILIEILNVTRRPSLQVMTFDDNRSRDEGFFVAQLHPVNQDVLLRARVLADTGGLFPSFKGTLLVAGEELVIRPGTVPIPTRIMRVHA